MQQKSNLTKVISWAAVAVVVLVMWLVYKFNFTEESKQAGPAAGAAAGGGKGPQTAFVTAYVAKPQVLEDNLSTRGTIMANEEVSLTSEVSGKIVKIYFKEGELVKQGQLLVKLDDEILQAQLQKANFELDFLEKKAQRETQLKDKGGVSIEQYESTLKDLNTKKAEIVSISAQIAKTKLIAPFSGQIGLRYVSEGAYITPSQRIADLIDKGQVKVDFSVPEKYLGTIKAGTPVSFTVEGANQTFKGAVYAVEPKIDQATRTIKLRAVCENGRGVLIPGAFANIQIQLSKAANAITIPTESVVPEMGLKKVFVVKGGMAQPQQIITGLRTPSRIEVIEGLSLGDTVIVSGILQVSPGAKVKITEIN